MLDEEGVRKEIACTLKEVCRSSALLASGNFTERKGSHVTDSLPHEGVGHCTVDLKKPTKRVSIMLSFRFL
jgi:hypothetical protein